MTRALLAAAAAGWLFVGALAQPEKLPAFPITALAGTPDGKSIITGSQAGVFIASQKTEELKLQDLRRLAINVDHVQCLSFSPDGKTLAVAGGRPAEAGNVELWSWPDEKLVSKFEGHTDLVHDIAWLGVGNTLATASADRTVRIWDVASGKLRGTLSGHSGSVLCLAAFPDGKTLCSGSTDQTIRVWSVPDGKLVQSLDNHLGAVHALALRPPQGKDEQVTLASASSDGTVRIWQPSIGRLVRIVRLPAANYCVAWSPDGSTFCCGGKDGQVRIIDGDSDKLLSETVLTKGWIVSTARLKDRWLLGTTEGEIRSISWLRAKGK